MADFFLRNEIYNNSIPFNPLNYRKKYTHPPTPDSNPQLSILRLVLVWIGVAEQRGAILIHGFAGICVV